MGFWETFWATMWGALGGAVVGALAAYVFSRDLNRRSRRAEYDMRMDAVVAGIAREIHTLIASPDTVPRETCRRRKKQGWNVESDRLLFLTNEAMVLARYGDEQVIRAIEVRFLSWLELRGDHHRYQLIADYSPLLKSAMSTSRDLAAWRRGDISNDEVTRRLYEDHSPVPSGRREPRRIPSAHRPRRGRAVPIKRIASGHG